MPGHQDLFGDAKEQARKTALVAGGPVASVWGVSETVDSTVSPSDYEPIREHARDERIGTRAIVGVTSRTAEGTDTVSDAAGAVGDAVPNPPDPDDVKKWLLILGAFILLVTGLSSTTFNVGGGD